MSQFSQNEILEIVNQILKQNTQTDTSLYEVFEDSIQMFRFLGEIKERLEIEFGMLDLVKAETIGDLVDKIQEKIGKSLIPGKCRKAGVQYCFRIKTQKQIRCPLRAVQLYFFLRREQKPMIRPDSRALLLQRHAGTFFKTYRKQIGSGYHPQFSPNSLPASLQFSRG